MDEDRTEDQASPPGRASRRDFVKVALRDSMGTAGQLAGLGGVVATSVAEAGRAMREGLEALADADAVTGAAPARADASGRPAASSLLESPMLPREQLPAPAQPLLDEVRHGVLATVASDGSPMLASGPFRYRDEGFIGSGRQLTAKIANIEREPRVSLVLTTADGDALVVGGRARIEAGEDAARRAREVHEEAGSSFPGDWSVTDGRGELVLIVVEPVRAHWRRADAAP